MYTHTSSEHFANDQMHGAFDQTCRLAKHTWQGSYKMWKCESEHV